MPASTELDFDSQFTLISGPNASGKTSLLESIYVLSRGRSFRTRHLNHLIRSGCERFVVFGEVERARAARGSGRRGVCWRCAREDGGEARRLAVGTCRRPPSANYRSGGASTHRGGPQPAPPLFGLGRVPRGTRIRRALAAVSASVETTERGAEIPAVPCGIASWDVELLQLGEYISEARSRYVLQLAAVARGMARNLLGMELSLSIRAGWAKDMSFAEALRTSFAHDQDTGVTQVGPHRAEIGIRLDGAPVRDRISRGQQKLLAAALLMAQLKLFPQDSTASDRLCCWMTRRRSWIASDCGLSAKCARSRCNSW